MCALIKQTLAERLRYLFCCIFLFLLLPGFLFSSVVTYEKLREAILGTKTFSESELKDMDINSDGKVDVSDIIAFSASSYPKITFDGHITKATEGDGSIQIKLNLLNDYSGDVNLRLDKIALTEDTGDDIQIINVTTNQGEVNVNLNISEDTFIEDIEIFNIVITPANGEEYKLGPNCIHTLYLYDNDSRWTGKFDYEGLSIGVDMDIINQNSAFSAAVISKGSDGLPVGTWTMNNFQKTENLFGGDFGPINQSNTSYNNMYVTEMLIKTELTRTINLNTVYTDDDNNDNDIGMIAADVITGVISEQIVADDQKHLDKTNTGRFIFIKNAQKVAEYDIVLSDAP